MTDDGKVGWDLRHERGSAATFHARPLPDRPYRSVRVLEVVQPALVLGSTQAVAVVDHAAATAAGVEVVRRRSGGGAVLLRPGETTWVDVVVPAGDPLAAVDVGHSFAWLGEVWAAVVADLAPGSDPAVHRGPMEHTPWSSLVCFAGRGPGEVTIDDAKVVGMAQRRGRAGARFQCALLHRWDPGAMVDLLALPPADRDRARTELIAAGRGLDVTTATVTEALMRRLPAERGGAVGSMPRCSG
ncbi:hypothetical protein BH20ACT2_BH20ACT2_04040 [soil metagenome]